MYFIFLEHAIEIKNTMNIFTQKFEKETFKETQNLQISTIVAGFPQTSVVSMILPINSEPTIPQI